MLRSCSAERHRVERADDAPKALIAWSSGKDSAWALHEVRRAGDFDIVGALTTVTDTFGRVSMHGVREELLRAQLEAAGLAADPACAFRFRARTRSTRRAWRRRWRDAKARRRHACDLRRSVSGGRARLSRAEARRHRHRAGVSAVAAADRGAGARDDRRRGRDLSGLRRSQAVAEGVSPAAGSTRRCSPNCRPAPIPAARTANSIPSWRPGRCWRGGFR